MRVEIPGTNEFFSADGMTPLEEVRDILRTYDGGIAEICFFEKAGGFCTFLLGEIVVEADGSITLIGKYQSLENSGVCYRNVDLELAGLREVDQNGYVPGNGLSYASVEMSIQDAETFLRENHKIPVPQHD